MLGHNRLQGLRGQTGNHNALNRASCPEMHLVEAAEHLLKQLLLLRPAFTTGVFFLALL